MLSAPLLPPPLCSSVPLTPCSPPPLPVLLCTPVCPPTHSQHCNWVTSEAYSSPSIVLMSGWGPYRCAAAGLTEAAAAVQHCRNSRTEQPTSPSASQLVFGSLLLVCCLEPGMGYTLHLPERGQNRTRPMPCCAVLFAVGTHTHTPRPPQGDS